MKNHKSLSLSLSQTKNSRSKRLSSNLISNKTVLHKFIERPFTDFDITIVPPNIKLYQGTDFNFTNKTIEDYYDYYDGRHNGAYFLSTIKIASLYGLNKDFSNIIYTTVPDSQDIAKPRSNYDTIYPLYYIPGMKGTNIEYKTMGNLILLDISNKKNLSKIWKIIDERFLSKEENELYKDVLFNTVIEYNPSYGYSKFSGKSFRRSYVKDDDELIIFFNSVLVPYFKEKFNIDLNGWIYYKDVSGVFSDEICILKRNVIEFSNSKRLPSSIYANIPSRDKFLKSIEHLKVKNNSAIKYNTILNNYCIVR